MKKFYKIAGIVAGALLLVGALLIGIGCATGAKKSAKLFNIFNVSIGEGELTKLNYTEINSFKDIDVDLYAGDVVIKTGDEFAIEYALPSDSIVYKVKDDKLIVSSSDTHNWKNLSFNFGWKNTHSYLTIYVPEGTQLNTVDVDCNMGDVSVYDHSIDTLYAYSDMGDVLVKNATLNSATTGTSMGKVTVEADVKTQITATNNMGDITLVGYLAGKINANTNMGDASVTTYYSDKCYTYDCDTSMGDHSVRRNGGKKVDADYSLKVYSDMGDATIVFTDK